MNRKLRAKIVEVFGTQSDFAQAVNEDETYVSRIVRGRRSLNSERVEKWAAALKCEPSQLASLMEG
jgi:transcriptional regulator with XRE-family HTH domain